MSFTTFLFHQLRIAGINDEYIPSFLNDENIALFQKAFTHPSYNEHENYEILEFMGDGILKGILTMYIPRRFPDLTTSEGRLSKVRRLLEMSETLSKIALGLGFWNYVRGDQETMTKKRNKTLEDVYEAFIGALVLAIDKQTSQGVGFSFAQKYVEQSLNQINIDISADSLDDPITILNELYKKTDDTKGKILNWNFFPKYTFEHIILPNFDFLNPYQHPDGTMYFDKKIKQAMVKYKTKFIPIKHLVYPIQLLFPATTFEDLEKNPEKFTKVRLARVYAKPKPDILSYLQKDLQVIPVFNKELEQIVMGQGIALQQKESKKMAANHAYCLFKQMGYKR